MTNRRPTNGSAALGVCSKQFKWVVKRSIIGTEEVKSDRKRFRNIPMIHVLAFGPHRYPLERSNGTQIVRECAWPHEHHGHQIPNPNVLCVRECLAENTKRIYAIVESVRRTSLASRSKTDEHVCVCALCSVKMVLIAIRPKSDLFLTCVQQQRRNTIKQTVGCRMCRLVRTLHKRSLDVLLFSLYRWT